MRARFDSGFHNEKLFEALERRAVAYLCGVALNPRILGVIREIEDRCWVPCLDKDEGEVAEFGYRQADSKVFRRYVVKRIPRNHGEQLDLESGAYNYWVLVTNDHTADAAALESEHRHKALVESGMRELKENFGLEVLRKHQFMANWAWLLIVVTAHNLIRLTQLLGGVEPGADLRGQAAPLPLPGRPWLTRAHRPPAGAQARQALPAVRSFRGRLHPSLLAFCRRPVT